MVLPHLGASILPPEPVVKRFHNIEHRDALLAFDRVEPAVDEDGNALYRGPRVGTR
jgi:hypothetical protein